DEATAAAEAMTLAKRSVKSKSNVFVVAGDTHPQTIEVIQTRARPLGIEVKLANSADEWAALMATDYFAALAQYPSTAGRIDDLSSEVDKAHAKQAAFIVAADLLALTVLVPPGEWGADIVVGSTQRFGMPMGAGGPHAAFMACRDEYKRSLPGRLVGVSIDSHGNPAYRLALQTREQHIRREKATSNICTAQVLPAVVASMYAVYHGPQGLKRIAERVAAYTAILAKGLEQAGVPVRPVPAFDTLCMHLGAAEAQRVVARARELGANIRLYWQEYVCVTLDETTTRDDIALLWSALIPAGKAQPQFAAFEKGVEPLIPEPLRRASEYLTHPVFNTHHSETGMLRYIRALSDKDLALDRTMIPLGSCTMKLNATSEMIPITWPEFAQVHPFAPRDQLQGYAQLDEQLRAWLCEATGYAAISLQPNAGSQGEYAGLLAIKAFHESRGDGQRTVCLIPSSAHGTNPAIAQMVGMQVVVTACDEWGNVDMADLKAKCEQHSDKLAAVMITYPSTHGVFETEVKALCALVHDHGGRVYVDGANMNALVGVAAPGEFGGDVSHLNLHKTFCIPHGGGGPGVGPVCVVADLAPFLPGHETAAAMSGLAEPFDHAHSVGAVSAAPLGNAAVLPISWMYCRMMGAQGLTHATEVAILSANYISKRLADHYPTLYASRNGHVAHECILDLRPLKDVSGITAEDVAKRLIDYGFHAPTLSFPVPGTLMVEPTESETLEELDRFIDAMIAIRGEIRRIEQGEWPKEDNPLKHAPHTAASLLKGEWTHAYTRETGAAILDERRHAKYWPPVGRVDNVYGDRNLFCACVPTSAYE
ncbi:MAG TPA: aminomethyl-transferring glycine dehydrogenase, partial [Ramlibacter sp.]|nr:aminomethyl-transferring glycine dehydrogenase [Ramlibacter sp.]